MLVFKRDGTGASVCLPPGNGGTMSLATRIVDEDAGIELEIAPSGSAGSEGAP